MKTSNKSMGFSVLTAETKDACLVRQHQTGASFDLSQMTHSSLPQDRIKKLGMYAFYGLCMTGIVPMFIAAWLIMAIDAFGAIVLAPALGAAVLLASKAVKRYV